MFLNSLIVAYKLQFALLCSVEITLANIIISDKQLTKQGCMLEFSNPPQKKKKKKKSYGLRPFSISILFLFYAQY